MHDALRPDVHPAAGRHLSVVGNAQLRRLVEVGGVVELAHHKPVGVDHPGRVAVAWEQSHWMPGSDHQGLGVGHLLQVLLHQPVLHPVLEHLPGLAVRHQLIRIQRDGEIQVVVDVELQRPGLEDTPVRVDRPGLDVPVGADALLTGPRPESVAVDAAPLPKLGEELGRHHLVQRRRDVAQSVPEGQRGLPGRQRTAPVGRAADARRERGRQGQFIRKTQGHWHRGHTPERQTSSNRLSTIWLEEKSWICM